MDARPRYLLKLNPSAMSKFISYANLMRFWNNLTGKLRFDLSAIPENPSTIMLDASSKKTYQTCLITSRTNITLQGGTSTKNRGIEHYILFYNSGSSDCVIVPAAALVAPDTITVKAGKCLEISWIQEVSGEVIITASQDVS